MLKDNSKVVHHALGELPEEYFRTICDRLPAMVAVYNIYTGRYSYVNFAVKKLLGYEREVFLKGDLESVSTLVHPDDIKAIVAKNSLALKQANEDISHDASSEPIVSFQYRMRHADGHWVWLHTDGSVFSRKNGKVEAVLNISIDISEHKEMENKLKKTNTKLETAERFALSQRVAKVGTFEWDLITNQVKWSPELEVLHGIPIGSFSGKYEEVEKFIYPADKKKIEKEVRASIADNIPFNCEYRVIRPDGTIRWMLGRGEVMRNKNGEATRFVGANVDITDRKEIEDRLRASEERYQAFIRNSSEAIWRFELDKPIPVDLPIEKQIQLMYKHAYLAEANDAMASMYGLRSAKKLIGSRLSDLFVERDPANTEYLRAFIKFGYALYGTESHEKDKKGKDKYFINSLIGIVENGLLTRAWGTQQDVTEQRKAAQALKTSEERLALALKASKLGIWEWNIKSGELIWSEQLKKIYGFKPTEQVTYEKYLSVIHPEDLSEATQIIRSSLKNGRGYQLEHRIIWRDGSVHWVLGQGQAFMKGGKPERMIGTTINIDDRKAAEQLQVETAVLSAERKELLAINAAKDEFIALASHQLRTPATGVKQYIGLLLEGYGGKLNINKEQLHMLKTAYESNERQLKIVNGLLLIAQLDAGKVRLAQEKLDLVKLLKDIVNEQSIKFKTKKQKINFNIHITKASSYLDHERMRMALENIIDNASKYSPDGKSITISVSKEDSFIVIKVKDRGVGIRKKDLPKLFQKFSRIENPLSTAVGGTGLGLYWSHKIIQLHGGELTVNSKINEGTTFKILLPIYKHPMK